MSPLRTISLASVLPAPSSYASSSYMPMSLATVTFSPAFFIALLTFSFLAATLWSTRRPSVPTRQPDHTGDVTRLAADLAGSPGQPASSGIIHKHNASGGAFQSFPASMTFSEFSALVRGANLSIRSAPVTAIECVRTPIQEGALGGIDVFKHHYILATVLLPSTDSAVHARPKHTYLVLDMCTDAWGMFVGFGPAMLRVMRYDDRRALTRFGSGGAPYSRLALSNDGQAAEGGPSLDALAGLLAVVDARVPRGRLGYSIFSRNCLWLCELLFFGMGRQFGGHWLQGSADRRWVVRRYLRGEMGLLAAALECRFPTNAVFRWVAYVGASGVRRMQTFVTWGDSDRVLMQDDEMEQILRDWKDWVPAKASLPLCYRSY